MVLYTLYTRIFQFVNTLFTLVEKKTVFLKKAFSPAVLFLLIGFIFGSCFGTFLFCLRTLFFWDGLLVFALLSIFELISCFHYKKPVGGNGRLSNQGFTLFVPSFCFCFQIEDLNKLCNLFKIGLIFGFFVDAFKVGS